MLGRFFKKQDTGENLDGKEVDPRARNSSNDNNNNDDDDSESGNKSFLGTMSFFGGGTVGSDDKTVDTTSTGMLMDRVKNDFLKNMEGLGEKRDSLMSQLSSHSLTENMSQTLSGRNLFASSNSKEKVSATLIDSSSSLSNCLSSTSGHSKKEIASVVEKKSVVVEKKKPQSPVSESEDEEENSTSSSSNDPSDSQSQEREESSSRDDGENDDSNSQSDMDSEPLSPSRRSEESESCSESDPAHDESSSSSQASASCSGSHDASDNNDEGSWDISEAKKDDSPQHAVTNEHRASLRDMLEKPPTHSHTIDVDNLIEVCSIDNSYIEAESWSSKSGDSTSKSDLAASDRDGESEAKVASSGKTADIGPPTSTQQSTEVAQPLSVSPRRRWGLLRGRAQDESNDSEDPPVQQLSNEAAESKTTPELQESPRRRWGLLGGRSSGDEGDAAERNEAVISDETNSGSPESKKTVSSTDDSSDQKKTGAVDTSEEIDGVTENNFSDDPAPQQLQESPRRRWGLLRGRSSDDSNGSDDKGSGHSPVTNTGEQESQQAVSSHSVEQGSTDETKTTEFVSPRRRWGLLRGRSSSCEDEPESNQRSTAVAAQDEKGDPIDSESNEAIQPRTIDKETTPKAEDELPRHSSGPESEKEGTETSGIVQHDHLEGPNCNASSIGPDDSVTKANDEKEPDSQEVVSPRRRWGLLRGRTDSVEEAESTSNESKDHVVVDQEAATSDEVQGSSDDLRKSEQQQFVSRGLIGRRPSAEDDEVSDKQAESESTKKMEPRADDHSESSVSNQSGKCPSDKNSSAGSSRNNDSNRSGSEVRAEEESCSDSEEVVTDVNQNGTKNGIDCDGSSNFDLDHLDEMKRIGDKETLASLESSNDDDSVESSSASRPTQGRCFDDNSKEESSCSQSEESDDPHFDRTVQESISEPSAIPYDTTLESMDESDGQIDSRNSDEGDSSHSDSRSNSSSSCSEESPVERHRQHCGPEESIKTKNECNGRVQLDSRVSGCSSTKIAMDTNDEHTTGSTPDNNSEQSSDEEDDLISSSESTAEDGSDSDSEGEGKEGSLSAQENPGKASKDDSNDGKDASQSQPLKQGSNHSTLASWFVGQGDISDSTKGGKNGREEEGSCRSSDDDDSEVEREIASMMDQKKSEASKKRKDTEPVSAPMDNSGEWSWFASASTHKPTETVSSAPTPDDEEQSESVESDGDSFAEDSIKQPTEAADSGEPQQDDDMDLAHNSTNSMESMTSVTMTTMGLRTRNFHRKGSRRDLLSGADDDECSVASAMSMIPGRKKPTPEVVDQSAMHFSANRLRSNHSGPVLETMNQIDNGDVISADASSIAGALGQKENGVDQGAQAALSKNAGENSETDRSSRRNLLQRTNSVANSLDKNSETDKSSRRSLLLRTNSVSNNVNENSETDRDSRRDLLQRTNSARNLKLTRQLSAKQESLRSFAEKGDDPSSSSGSEETESDNSEAAEGKIVVKEAPLLRLENVTAATRSKIQPTSTKGKKGRWSKWFGRNKRQQEAQPVKMELESSESSEASEPEAEVSNGVVDEEYPITEAQVSEENEKEGESRKEDQEAKVKDQKDETQESDKGAKAQTVSIKSSTTTSTAKYLKKTEGPAQDQKVPAKEIRDVKLTSPSKKMNHIARPSTLANIPAEPDSPGSPESPMRRSHLSAALQPSAGQVLPKPTTPKKKKKKKNSLNDLLEKQNTRRISRHGDEVSVGTTNIKHSSMQSGRVVQLSVLNHHTFDDQSVISALGGPSSASVSGSSGKRRPWSASLKNGKLKSEKKNGHGSGNFDDDEEDLKKIDILGKTEELFCAHVVGEDFDDEGHLPVLTETIEESDSEEDGEESSETEESIHEPAQETELERKSQEDEKPVLDFDEMWDDVSCDLSTAIEFDRSKRKKNREKEKKRRKLEQEREMRESATKRLRLFEKRSDKEKEGRRRKKKSKLSEEFIDALRKVFDDGSVNSADSCSDSESDNSTGDGFNDDGSCDSLYLPDIKEEENEDASQGSGGTENSNSGKRSLQSKNSKASRSSKASRTSKRSTAPSRASRSSSHRSNTTSNKKIRHRHPKRSELDSSEIFLKEVAKLKGPKVLTIQKLRQEMIDRRGTSVNLLRKEYTTFRKTNAERRSSEELEPVDFEALTSHANTLNFGEPKNSEVEEQPDGLGATLSRWANAEGVSALDDLATVVDDPKPSNLFGVSSLGGNKSVQEVPDLNTFSKSKASIQSSSTATPSSASHTARSRRQAGREMTNKETPDTMLFSANFTDLPLVSIQEHTDDEDNFGLLAGNYSDDDGVVEQTTFTFKMPKIGNMKKFVPKMPKRKQNANNGFKLSDNGDAGMGLLG